MREVPDALANIFMVHGAGGGAWAWEIYFSLCRQFYATQPYKEKLQRKRPLPPAKILTGVAHRASQTKQALTYFRVAASINLRDSTGRVSVCAVTLSYAGSAASPLRGCRRFPSSTSGGSDCGWYPETASHSREHRRTGLPDPASCL